MRAPTITSQSRSALPSCWPAFGRRFAGRPQLKLFTGLPIRLGDVEIDFQARRITSGERQVRLTPKELDLLWYLVAHPNRAIAHRELLAGHLGSGVRR